MRIGEIIETSTIGFWAESAALHDLPPLGTLVTVAQPDGLTLYGVVAFGQTAGIDEGRRAVRRGTDEVFDGAIYDRHPELTRILRTTFRVVTVGYEEPGGLPRHHLPPMPPPLHYSVGRCEQAALERFTTEPRYFATLAASDGDVPSEQLLAAHIRAIYAERGRDPQWLLVAGQQVSRLLKRDYDRLMTVLEAIDPGETVATPAASPRLRALPRANGPGMRSGHDSVPF